jgi:hypothetical protein
MTVEAKALIDTIFEKYYVSIKNYLLTTYTEELNKNQSDHKILGDF